MALKTLVKVGEITNLSDARYCAGMGVEMLGFNLNPDAETYVSPEQFKEITEWVAGVKFVGEVGGLSLESINQLVPEYTLDLIQVSDHQRGAIFELDLPVILSLNSPDFNEIEPELHKIKNHVDYFLLENFPDTAKLVNLATDYPVLFGDNVEANNVTSLVETTPIKGIALKGSMEEKPGFKDYDQLADILEVLETED